MTDHAFRKTWSKDEYHAKAVALEQSGPPPTDTRHVPSKESDFTGVVTARQGDLALDALVGTRVTVEDPSKIGFYCDACEWSAKDSNSWLDHLNSHDHARRTGKIGVPEEPTLDEVTAALRVHRREALFGTSDDDSGAKKRKMMGQDAFQARLDQLKLSEDERKAEKKRRKKQRKLDAKRAQRHQDDDGGDDDGDDDDGDEKRWEDVGDTIDPNAVVPKDATSMAQEEDQMDMMSLMGFSGFDSTKRR